MLAGCCSSTLLSPTHRLRSEASAQFHQACHFQVPSMSTQRLDLPCSFPRKKDTSRSQPIRPVGLSVDNRPIEAYSLKHTIRLPPLATATSSSAHQTTPFVGSRRDRDIQDDEFWGKSLKRRLAEHGSVDVDESSPKRKKKGSSDDVNVVEGLSLAQMGAGNFWLQPGEEERGVCFVPSEVESAITKITDLGEKNEAEGSHIPLAKEASGNSSLRLNENGSEHEVGNGNGNRNGSRNPQEEHRGFELVSLLTACVDAIGSKNVAEINHLVAKLGELASPRGTPISRVCAHFTEALAMRVTRVWPHVFQINIPREAEDESGTALRLLNEVSPIPKFLHFTSNEMLLRAFEGKDRVHIIDFDIKQGLQWPSLFQSLASRTNPPSHVRITGIGESKHELNETGDRLAGFAEALNLPFEFHPVVDRLEDVRLWMLHVKEHESVAVNCVLQLHKTLYGGALRDFLGLIRSTNPAVMVMAEQEAEHDEARLDARVCNSLKYYSALFDSVDECVPAESVVRSKIEEMYGREIRDIVACEGRDRVERHRSFGKWRKMMEQGGFRWVGFSERERVQSQLLLKMYSCCNGFSVKGQAALTLGWGDNPLYTVSAWAPLDAAGGPSSSSVSQTT
ncbi:Scarecrow protein 28 [Spatholobus suberectus]|nr:Scarecrow protein 28 [Spatholobus suberectus]